MPLSLSTGTPPGICQIISTFRPVVGGAQRMTENLARELAREGAPVMVLTRRFPGLSRSEDIDGVRVLRLGYPSRSKLGALTFGIHALLLLATRLRHYRLIHAQSTETPLWVGFLAKLLFGKRLVLTLHSDPRVRLRIRGDRGGLRLRLTRLLADGVGVLNGQMGEEMITIGVDASRVHVLPNGIETDRVRPATGKERRQARRVLNLEEDHVVYLFVGRLAHSKRIRDLLRAWACLSPLPPSTLLIVGEGSERPALEAECEELDLRNVRFEGRTENVLLYLQAADVFTLPSDREGQSIALLEAMAAGLTPVVSDIRANTQLVQHQVNGLIFAMGEIDDLAQQLRIAGEPTIRGELGGNAVRNVRSHYSLRASVQAHRQMYAATLNGA